MSDTDSSMVGVARVFCGTLHEQQNKKMNEGVTFDHITTQDRESCSRDDNDYAGVPHCKFVDVRCKL